MITKCEMGTPLHHPEMIILIDESAMRSDVEVLHNIDEKKCFFLIRVGFGTKSIERLTNDSMPNFGINSNFNIMKSSVTLFNVQQQQK